MPVLVQIVFWYNALPVLTNNAINLPALVAGTLALGLNEGAYMTEIIRSGLMSVDPGQREAARALGMTKAKAMRRIVMPQALRVIIPPTGNQFIAMLKTTSLLFAIAVPEIFATGTGIYGRNFKYFEVLAVVSIWYLLLTGLLTLIQKVIERRFHRAHSVPPRRPSGRGTQLMALVEIRDVHKRFGAAGSAERCFAGRRGGRSGLSVGRQRQRQDHACFAASIIWRPSIGARSRSRANWWAMRAGKMASSEEEPDRITSAKRARIGMVFQRFNLFAHLTALENVVEAPVQVLGVAQADAEKRALDLLARVGLKDKAGHYPHELSGGQQQRVAIARAVAMEPG